MAVAAVVVALGSGVASGVPRLTSAEAQGPATSAPVSVTFDGRIGDIEREGTGLRLALTADDGSAEILHLDAAGQVRSREPITLPEQTVEYETRGVVLTSGGAVALLVGGTAGDGNDGDLILKVASRDRGVNRLEQITPAGRQAFPQAPLVVGPTGAIGVGFYEDLPGRRAILKLAFRPAGAAGFNRPVTVGAPHHGIDEMKIVMAQNGGGVVFSLPDIQDRAQRPTSIRRISPRGRVGRAIRVPLNVPGARQWLVSAEAAFRRDGTLFASFIADSTEDTATWFAALGPRATTPSLTQRLSRGGVDVGVRNIDAVFVDRSGRANALIERNTSGPATTLFAGTAKGVRRVPAFAPAFADSALLDELADGRLIAIWAGSTTRRRHGIVATVRRANGSFTRPKRLAGSPTDPDDIEVLTGFAALSGGRIAVTWAGTEDRGAVPPDSLLIVSAPAD